MRWYRLFPFAIFVLVTIYGVLKPATAQAQYDSPEDITLKMYRLVQGSGDLLLDPVTRQSTPCTKDDPAIAQSFGCTAITDDPDHAYPFATYTVTIGIEGEIYNGIQQGYLQNVVPHELDIAAGSQGNKPL